MRFLPACLLAGLFAAAGLSASVGQEIPSAQLRQRRQAQEQVRVMGRSLIVRVLDVQLQQLRENRLESHPWYADILSMRNHVDLLIEQEMSAVIETLDRLETAAPGDREEIFRTARRQARQVMARLAVERHSLLHRLKIAEIADQARKLIELQTAVLLATA